MKKLNFRSSAKLIVASSFLTAVAFYASLTAWPPQAFPTPQPFMVQAEVSTSLPLFFRDYAAQLPAETQAILNKTSSELNINNPWGTHFMAYNYRTYSNGFRSPIQQVSDLNGDGLPDYLYVEHGGEQNKILFANDIVFLNNGNGWDLAYFCSYREDTHYHERQYRGHCAK